MFHPLDHPLERGWVGRDRRRARDPARGADPPVVLHRRRNGARACRVPARRGAAARAGAPSARDPRLRRADVVRVRESRGRPRPRCRTVAERPVARARSPSRSPGSLGARRAHRGRSRCSRTGAAPQRGAEGPRLRAWPRSRRRRRPTSSLPCPRSSSRVARARRTFEPRRLSRLGDRFDWDERRSLAADGTELLPGRSPRRAEQRRRSTRWTRAARSRSRSRSSERPHPADRPLMRLVLDWDGTVTAVDGLDLALREFGDEGVYAKHEALLGQGPHAARGHRGRVPHRPGAARRGDAWARENTRLRAGFVELARARRPIVVSSGFHELIEPVLEREGLELEVRANRVERAPRRLDRAVPRRRAVLRLRRALQAADRGRPRLVRLRRRRLLGPLRRRGGEPRLRTSRAGRPTSRAERSLFEPFADFHDVERALADAPPRP